MVGFLGTHTLSLCYPLTLRHSSPLWARIRPLFLFFLRICYPSFVKRRALPGIRPGEIILYLLLLLILLLPIGLGPTGMLGDLESLGISDSTAPLFPASPRPQHRVFVDALFAVFELFLSRSTFLVIRSFFPARVSSTRTVHLECFPQKFLPTFLR